MADDDQDLSRDVPPDLPIGPEVLSALAAILALDPVTAARVRGITPSRRRPQRQTGPRLDLGAPDGDEPREDADGAEAGEG